MNVLIVHAHPDPDSFNSAMTRAARRTLGDAGHEVKISDLYSMGWDPVPDQLLFTALRRGVYYGQSEHELAGLEPGEFPPDVLRELEKVRWCDTLIFQFPLWWFGLPAILKGWVDRVLTLGPPYSGASWYDRGAFEGKRAMLSLTTGGSEALYGPSGLHGKMDTILFPIQHGILYFTGFEVLPPFIAWSPAHVGAEKREEYLEEYRRRLLILEETTPLPYPPLSGGDENLQRREG